MWERIKEKCRYGMKYSSYRSRLLIMTRMIIVIGPIDRAFKIGRRFNENDIELPNSAPFLK